MSQPTPIPPPPPLPLAAARERRRKPFPLLYPLVALALILLYNLIFSPSFFRIELNYVDIYETTPATAPATQDGATQPTTTAVPATAATGPTTTGVEPTTTAATTAATAPTPPPAERRVIRRQAQLFGQPINIFKGGAGVMLLAIGMTLVIATGGIDLSVGTIIAIASCLAGSLIQPGKESIFYNVHIAHLPFLVLAIALFSGILAGAWNGVLVSVFNIQPIVATLILMISGRGIAQIMTGGDKPTYSDYPVMDFIGKGYVYGFPVQMIIVLAAMVIAILLIRATALGMYIEAIGNNAQAAQVAGINARFVKFLVYTFSGLCAAMAGIMETAELRYPNYSAGTYKELDAIVAVAIGGTSLIGGRFSLIGSFLGAITMQALQTTILANTNTPSLNFVFMAAVVLLICLVQAENFRLLFTRAYLWLRPRNRARGAGA